MLKWDHQHSKEFCFLTARKVERWGGKLLELHVLFCFFLIGSSHRWFDLSRLVKSSWGALAMRMTRSTYIYVYNIYVIMSWFFDCKHLLFASGVELESFHLDFPLAAPDPSERAQTAATASNDVTRSFWRCQLKLISTFHGSIWLGFEHVFDDTLRCICTHSWSHSSF